MNTQSHMQMLGSHEMEAIVDQLEEGKFEEALAALDAVLIAYPPITVAVLSLKAEVLEHLARYEESLACYDRILDKERVPSIREETIPHSGWIECWLKKAGCLERLNREEEALAAYSEALRLCGRDPLLYSLVGQAYARKGRYAEALTAFEQALAYAKVQQVETIPLACHLMNLANAFSSLQRYRQAIDLYRQAMQCGHLASPLNQVVQYNLACTLALDGQYTEAYSLLNELLGQEPFAFALSAQREVERKLGRQGEQDLSSHRLVRLSPLDDPESVRLALATYRQSGQSILFVRLSIPMDYNP